MRHLFVTGLAVAAAAMVWTSSARADEILLKNGNIIRGAIVSEDEQSVTIRISVGGKDAEGHDRFVEMTFPKSAIQRVTRGADLFTPKEEQVVVPKETAAPEAATPPVEEKKPPEPESKDAEKKDDALDPALQAKIDSLVVALGAEDVKTREEAEQQLTALGKDAVPTVVKNALMSGTLGQRIIAAKILRSAGDKRATRALIEQLASGRGDILPMRYAYYALKAITGQSIFFDERDNLAARMAEKQKWIDWYKTVVTDKAYKRQIGGPWPEDPPEKPGENDDAPAPATPDAKPGATPAPAP